MKAIIVNQFGDAAALEWQQSAMPQPKRGEALIRMKAAGVNFIDIYMRSGVPRVAPKLPFIPGREGAGIVETVGEDVTHVKPGDRVAYASGLGAYAEYSIVAADQLILLPDDVSFEQAGWLNLTIDQVLPLEDAAKAHALLESRKTTGKIVLKID